MSDVKYFLEDKIQEEEIQEKQIISSAVVKSDVIPGDNFEGLFPEFDKDLIEHIYNELYNIESRDPIDVSGRQISRIPLPVDLLRNAIDMLSSTYYEDLQIIVEQGPYNAINWEVQQKIINKIERWQQLNKLERIIMDVGAMIMSGYNFEGMVNSASDFHEKFFDKNF